MRSCLRLTWPRIFFWGPKGMLMLRRSRSSRAWRLQVDLLLPQEGGEVLHVYREGQERSTRAGLGLQVLIQAQVQLVPGQLTPRSCGCQELLALPRLSPSRLGELAAAPRWARAV